MLKLGLLAGGTAVFNTGFKARGAFGDSSFWDNPRSPSTRPFVDEMPRPPLALPTTTQAGYIPKWRTQFAKHTIPSLNLPGPRLSLSQFPSSGPVDLPPPKCTPLGPT